MHVIERPNQATLNAIIVCASDDLRLIWDKVNIQWDPTQKMWESPRICKGEGWILGPPLHQFDHTRTADRAMLTGLLVPWSSSRR
jgi:hypothetical protein